MDAVAQIRDKLAEWETDPAGFIRSWFGAEPDVWQLQVLEAVARGDRQVAVKSGHGVGKSCLLSWLAVWWIVVHYNAKVVITAPTSAQLHDTLLPELKSWLNQAPKWAQSLFNVKQDRIEFAPDPDRNFISARTSRAEQPDALQGVHAEHVLLIVDEASGVPEQVYDAAGGSMSAEHACMVLAGNPVRSTGYFYDAHTKLADTWTTFTVNCETSKRVSREYIEECRVRYGIESNNYRIRVLGEFPTGDDDTVIPMALIEGAVARDVQPSESAPMVWGLDVARFGSDASALCKRKGNAVPEPIRLWKNKDTMQVAGAVKAEYESSVEKPVEILIDSIGLGAGVVDRLREMGLPARGVNVAESPALGDTYLNLRAELWYKARGWLEKRDALLPRDERLKTELAMVRYTFTSSGKLKIESKDDIKKRGAPSPDAADAFVLTFASEAGIALHGYKTTKWTERIRRNLKIV